MHRDLATTFASSYSLRDLLAVVVVVAEAARPHDPQSVAQRAWDVAREAAGHPGAPRAHKLCERLGVDWATAKELAFAPARERDYRLGGLLGEAEDPDLSVEHAVMALKLAVAHLGPGTLTTGHYRRARAQLLAADHVRHTHGRQLRLPTENQIATLFGGAGDGWQAALAAAGLSLTDRDGQSPARDRPSIITVLERCYEAHGTEPNCGESERFARANGIPYPRRERPWAQYVAEWKARRRSCGLPVPDGPPPRHERPDYDTPVDGARRAGEPARQRTWDDEADVVAAMARFLAGRGACEKDSLRAYQDWARGRPDAPASSRFARFGGFAAVREKARVRDAPRDAARRDRS